MVRDTEVNFHCYNEEAWTINWLGGINHNSVTFITSNETGRDDDMLIATNQDYVSDYGSLSLIQCLHQHDHTSQFAVLVVEGE